MVKIVSAIADKIYISLPDCQSFLMTTPTFPKGIYLVIFSIERTVRIKPVKVHYEGLSKNQLTKTMRKCAVNCSYMSIAERNATKYVVAPNGLHSKLDYSFFSALPTKSNSIIIAWTENKKKLLLPFAKQLSLMNRHECHPPNTIIVWEKLRNHR